MIAAASGSGPLRPSRYSRNAGKPSTVPRSGSVTRTWSANTASGVEVAFPEGGVEPSHNLHVLLRHRRSSISRMAGLLRQPGFECYGLVAVVLGASEDS